MDNLIAALTILLRLAEEAAAEEQDGEHAENRGRPGKNAADNEDGLPGGPSPYGL